DDCEIIEHGVEFGSQVPRRHRMHGTDALRVLRGQRGDRAGALDAQRREGFQVGLDARATAGIGTGDGQTGNGRREHNPFRRSGASPVSSPMNPESILILPVVPWKWVPAFAGMTATIQSVRRIPGPGVFTKLRTQNPPAANARPDAG